MLSHVRSRLITLAHGVYLAALVGAGLSSAAAEDTTPHARMLRYPDISATHVVFSYANDLWLAPREGGVATLLASPPGIEEFPRFSPDGRTIAFQANYDGNTDIYTIPTAGGVPFRVTHHPAAERPIDWTSDGRLTFHAFGIGDYPRAAALFAVPATGGLFEKLPVPYGTNGVISADGQWLAYTPYSRDTRTWKRYRGGMASDVWLFNLTSHESRKITDWEGTDSQPMWHGNKVYYVSDAGPEHRWNVWVYDVGTQQRQQLTHFDEYDVKWPSIGPGTDGQGEIIMENGADLHLLDLRTRKTRVIDITIPGERPKIREQVIDVSGQIQDWDVSATGKRAVVQARGDIWTLPAEHGSPRNLTRTNGVAERDPAWSPDGRWIAYFSDATGEYQLYIMQSDGKGETKQLTSDGARFLNGIWWSPDSKHIIFGDKTGSYFLHTIESGETKFIDKDPWGTLRPGSWSHDAAWFAYGRDDENHITKVWLYDVNTGETHQVTSGMFNDTEPTFDRKGDFLYYVSARDFTSPIYEDVGGTFIYANTQQLLAVPLRADVDSPFLAKSDEEKWNGDKKDNAEEDTDKDDDSDENADGDKAEDEDDPNDESAQTPAAQDDDEPADEDHQASVEDEQTGAEEAADEAKDEEAEKEKEPLKIDLDGFEARAILLPVKRGRLGNLGVNDKGQLIYARGSRGHGGDTALKLFDPTDEKHEEKDVISDVRNYAITADGKKLLIRKNGKFAIINAAPSQKMDKTISTGGMTTILDPRSEWKQEFHEAWRIYRDYFYDANMHGVDWNAVGEQYGRMLPDCVSRDDLSFLIREMISELNVGHAYYWGGDSEKGPSMDVGLLGCDFELDNGAYRIARIIEGGAWDADARGPLSEPGVKVKEGDYLLAVNGIPLDVSKDPWAAFLGLANETVVLTVSDKPERDADAREVVVKLLSGDGDLRFRAWVERNRAYVEEQTDGKVGYIYVPDTGGNGQNELFRQFYGQIDKQALIIDERWNGGGQIPHRFIELLNRPATNAWANRDSLEGISPDIAHHGPKCMLINGLAGSGGDAFPAYFRKAGLGKLIGMRTWGGLVGISGNPGLIDGTGMSVPRFAYYDLDGTWGIEGHGVDPDIQVVDDPAKMAYGGDPQLDAAIELMLNEVKEHPFKRPPRPAPPNRSGMGIPESDH
ncbi:MAG: PD40 domain-containing protein [Phycisphaerae bacterium]|nr:PD40 domain-containing protein [Phycisphaerae bacterium]